MSLLGRRNGRRETASFLRSPMWSIGHLAICRRLGPPILLCTESYLCICSTFVAKCICIKIKVFRPLHCLPKIGSWKPFRHINSLPELILQHAKTSFNDSTTSRWSWIWWLSSKWVRLSYRTKFRASNGQVSVAHEFASSFVAVGNCLMKLPSRCDQTTADIPKGKVHASDTIPSTWAVRESRNLFSNILFDPRQSAWSHHIWRII